MIFTQKQKNALYANLSGCWLIAFGISFLFGLREAFAAFAITYGIIVLVRSFIE